jgi:hypothetical protein
MAGLAVMGLNGQTAVSWNKAAAARYLDQRQSWWMSWPNAQRDHATACVSCHTALPYALARPALWSAPGENGPSPVERTMLENVTRRVSLWNELEPFYSDAKTGPRKSVESRGTEAVINALILASYDARQGRLNATTRSAFEAMWSLQLQSGESRGAWDWLNFHNAPWESDESQYWGAALAAVAVGRAPGDYRSEPGIQPNLALLRGYLTGGYPAQPLANRVVLLWASARLPGLLTTGQRSQLANEVFRLQQEDVGWSLTSLGKWARKDHTALETKSDGYATGLVVFALCEAGVASRDGRVEKALSWLAKNQDQAEGLWPAYSLNKQRDLATDTGRLMSDAATAYAVMALTEAR